MQTKIAVGLPTNRLVKPKSAHSIFNMVANSELDYHIIVSNRGYNTAENRNFITAKAIKAGCTHIMFLDDDMIYEPDTIENLLLHDKDIIGGQYFTKYEEQDFVMEFLDDKRPDELFKCGAMGGGLLLVKTDVFLKVPQPWFGYTWHANGMVKESNDWFFCYKAREHGYDVWCDPDVKAKHIGLKEY